jgi:hypothetical protein
MEVTMAQPPNPVHPSQHAPIHIDLTDAQKQQIIDYVRRTGHQPEISLVVNVVQDRIAPAAVAVGAA